MINIFKKKNKFKAISNWNQVSLKKHREIIEVLQEKFDEKYILKIVKILYPKELNAHQSIKAVVGINELLEKDVKNPQRIKNHYTFNGKKYKCDWNYKNWNTEQLIGYSNIVSTQFEWKDICAIFMYPDKHKWNDGYDYDEFTEELDKNVTIDLAYNMSDFFFKIYKSSVKLSLHSIQRQMKKVQKM